MVTDMEAGSNLGVSDQSCHAALPPVPGSVPLSFGSFFGGGIPHTTLIDRPNMAYLTSGRMAIAQALLQNHIGPGDEVLVPSYHCSSMIAPILHAGAKSVFYRIRRDMTVDLEDIATKTTSRCKMLMVAHYFGFPQPITPIRRFCDEQGILLLEDCAHALFTTYENRPLGSFGDYAAGSLMKFFPVNDGGFLVASANTPLELDTRNGGRSFELRAILNTLEKSFIYKRLKLLNVLLWLPLKIKNLLWRWVKSKHSGIGMESSPAASDGGFEFEPKWIHTSISTFSRLICNWVSTVRIVERRQTNYRWLAQALSDNPHFHPMFPTLPDNVVPYVFPLLVDNIDPAFANLRQKGVPLLRWENLDPGVTSDTCQWSSYYSRHLVQIPCHQELTQGELEQIVECIREEFPS